MQSCLPNSVGVLVVLLNLHSCVSKASERNALFMVKYGYVRFSI